MDQLHSEAKHTQPVQSIIELQEVNDWQIADTVVKKRQKLKDSARTGIEALDR